MNYRVRITSTNRPLRERGFFSEAEANHYLSGMLDGLAVVGFSHRDYGNGTHEMWQDADGKLCTVYITLYQN